MFSNIWSVNLAIFHWINWLGSFKTLSVVAVTLHENHVARFLILCSPYAYFWFNGKRDLELERKLMVGLVSVVLAIFLARGMAKFLPFEIRPMYDPASGFQPTFYWKNPDLEGWSSFPSDTAAVCIALTFSIFYINKLASLALMIGALVIFCLPRIMMGIHYPSDILVGCLVGIGSVMLINQISKRPWGSFWVVTNRLPDGVFYTIMVLYLSEASQMFGGIRSLKGIIEIFRN